MKPIKSLTSLLAACLLWLPVAYAQQQEAEDLPIDSMTSAEIVSGKVVWDISIRTTPKDFLINVSSIREAYDALTAFGVEPDMVFVFRGQSIPWLSDSHTQGRSWSSKTINQIKQILVELQDQPGIRMVADAVSGKRIKERAPDLMPSVIVVENAFVELINYQARGYAIIQLR